MKLYYEQKSIVGIDDRGIVTRAVLSDPANLQRESCSDAQKIFIG